ncbi:hypothetical protein [Flavobacterium sp.]|jgi:hypothetical protein|uniref:hypothetical protein n=1 Tax=Flavobacterium sp. TaxID=239 RepID=UPI0037C07249
MKYLKIITVGCFLMSVCAFGQFNNGFNRRMNTMPNNQQAPSQPSQKDIEENRNEQIDKQMLRLKSDLKLDDLQFIAIKNEILKSYKEIDVLLKKEFSDEDKNNQLKAIQDNTEKTILSYLNAEQKEKFNALKNENSKKKEDKGKKKKKDTEKESETNN